MSSARGNSEDAPISAYEQEKLANIARNKKRLESLKLPLVNTIAQPSQSKRRKKTYQTNGAATEGHNLRPRTQRNSSEIANEQIAHNPNCEAIGDFLCDNEDLQSGTHKKKGRGITRLDDIFSRTPKLEVWTDITAIYDLGDAAFKWFMTTAGIKWKEFKADLKEKYFDANLTDEELINRNGDRVNPADWNFLIGYWRSPFI